MTIICVENCLKFQDFFPIIGTFITVYAGYKFLSVTANKNRQVKWIDDFRNELAKFVSITNSLIHEFKIEKSYEMISSAVLLRFYLYETKQPTDNHKKLDEKIKEIQELIIDNGKQDFNEKLLLEYAKLLPEILNLATFVIKTERNRI